MNVSAQVIVQVLDKQYDLADFLQENIPDLLCMWELGGITDPLGQLINWLWEQIQGLADTVRSKLEGFITGVRDAITGFVDDLWKYTVKPVIDGISSLLDTVWSSLQGFTAYVEGAFTTVTTSLSTISLSVSSIIASLSQIGARIMDVLAQMGHLASQISSTVASWVGQVLVAVQSLGDSLMDFISRSFTGMTAWLVSLFQYLSTSVSQVMYHLQSFGLTVASWFTELGERIGTMAEGMVNAVKGVMGDLVDFLSTKVREMMMALGEVRTVLQGFVNPLVEIKNWFFNLGKKLVESFKEVPSMVVNWVKGLWGSLKKFFEWAWESLQAMAKKLVEAFSTMVGVVSKGVFEAAKKVAETLQNLYSQFLIPMLETFVTGVKDVWQKVTTVALGGEAIAKCVTTTYKVSSGILGVSLVARTASAFVTSIGAALDKAKVRIGIPGTNITFDFKPGVFIEEMGRALWDVPGELLRGFAFGISMWLSEPLRRMMNANLCEQFPIEIPSLTMMVEMTRRLTPRDEEFKEYLKWSDTWLSYYGYAKNVRKWFTTTADKWNVEITDRFGTKRKLPVPMLYDLPTGSEMCRMMIKDIFGSVDDFVKAISMVGHVPDVAYMYYFLHFKYPSPRDLWEFYCRAKAGMLWYKPPDKLMTEARNEASKVGAYAPVAPKDLNENPELVREAIDRYMKWHDYAPFAWVQGFTADKWIEIDLMAEMPTKLDARWMYKWMVIDDETLKKVVIARGYHPDWVDRVATAEMMNAMAEERTLARTGLTRMAEWGYMALNALDSKLKELTTIKLLGKDVPVAFLEGERKLLVLRAEHDRFYHAIDRAFDEAVRAFTANIITKEAVISHVEEVAKAVKSPYKLDTDFLGALLKAYEIKWKREVVQRIRGWMWTFTWRVSELAERGYDVATLVEDYAKKAELSDEEKKLIEELAELSKKAYTLSLKITAILNKQKRGEITPEETVKQLTQLGIEEDVARDIVESRAKIYTFSLDRLIDMMEYVPVPEDLLNKRVASLGVPEEEAKLLPAYAFAREHNEEMGKLVSAYERLYIEGKIDDQTFRQALDDIATLWGQAKTVFGVDWILYSPIERQFLFYAAKLRRILEQNPKSRLSSVSFRS